MAGHVGDLVGEEGEDGLGDFFGFGDSADGEASVDHGEAFADEGLAGHFGKGEAGGDGVDEDLVLAEFDSGVAGEGLDGGFGGGVGDAVVSADGSVPAGDVDDVAGFLGGNPALGEEVGEVVAASEVGVDHLVECFGGCFDEGGTVDDSGVVDGGVGEAELLLDLVEGGFDLVGVGDVAEVGVGIIELFESLGVNVEGGDGEVVLEEELMDGFSDAGTGTGDDGDFWGCRHEGILAG